MMDDVVNYSVFKILGNILLSMVKSFVSTLTSIAFAWLGVLVLSSYADKLPLSFLDVSIFFQDNWGLMFACIMAFSWIIDFKEISKQ
jgi:hypothetical protein